MIRSLIILVLLGCSGSQVDRFPTATSAEDRSASTESLSPAERLAIKGWDEQKLERTARWVGTADSEVCLKYIRPLLEREGIPYMPRAKSLGMTEFGSDTPENTRRARALIEADSRRNGYEFTKGIDAPPVDDK